MTNDVVHPYFDPRRTRTLFASIGGAMTLQEWIGRLARGGVTLMFAIVLPLWYVIRTIRRRRWSLAWLMMAPLVLGLAIVVWRSQLWGESDRLSILISGTTLWMCGGLLVLAARACNDDAGYSVRLMLLVGTPVVFVAMLLFGYPRGGDPTLRYELDWNALIRVLLMSFAVVAQIYWVLRLFGSLARFATRSRQRQAAT